MAAAGVLAGFVWGWILPLALQATLLLAAAALLDRLLPRAVWPEVRVAALGVLLLRLLLPPAPGSVFPLLERAWPGGLALFDLAPFDPLAPGTRLLGFAVAAAWTLGCAGVVGLEALRAGRRAALWRRAQPLDAELRAAWHSAGARLGLGRLPEARVVDGLVSPCVFGAWRPRILLPAGLSAAEAEPALLHELTHVRQGDLWLGVLTGLVGALYWFHPLVRLAARRLADLREVCCDRAVARRIGPGLAEYRRALLEFAARRHGRALAGLSFVGGSSLLARLAALERAERDRPRLRRLAALLVALTTFGCAAVVGPPAERRAREMAEIITRPPGCLQLRYLIMERMARERRTAPPPITPEH